METFWQHFWKAACAKGPRSIRIKWIKGHATQQHIDDLVIAQADKDGNHMAEHVADIAALWQGHD